MTFFPDSCAARISFSLLPKKSATSSKYSIPLGRFLEVFFILSMLSAITFLRGGFNGVLELVYFFLRDFGHVFLFLRLVLLIWSLTRFPTVSANFGI
jgi:hypothetical protein